MGRLLIRDLRQLVSPAGRDAPLRGRALADLDWIDEGTSSARTTGSPRSGTWRTSGRSTAT